MSGLLLAEVQHQSGSLCRTSSSSSNWNPSNVQICSRRAWNGPMLIVLYSHVPLTALLQRLFGGGFLWYQRDLSVYQRGMRCISPPQHIIKAKPPSSSEGAEFQGTDCFWSKRISLKPALDAPSSQPFCLPVICLFVSFFLFVCVCFFFWRADCVINPKWHESQKLVALRFINYSYFFLSQLTNLELVFHTTCDGKFGSSLPNGFTERRDETSELKVKALVPPSFRWTSLSISSK